MIRVLIAEDEPAARRFLVSLVERHSPRFAVIGTAEDGAEAIKLLGETSADIVITDIQMMRMDGIALADWVARHRPDALTVIVSGHNDFEYAKGAIRAGVVEYLLKPVVPSDFDAMMRQLGERIEAKHRGAKRALLQSAALGQATEDVRGVWEDACCWLGAVRLGGAPGAGLADAGLSQFQDALVAVDIPQRRALCFVLEGVASQEEAEAAAMRLGGCSDHYTACLTRATLPEGFRLLPLLLARAAEAEVPGVSCVGVLPGTSKGEGEQLISAILRHIDSHLEEPLSIQDVCAAFGISGSYLSQLFRKHVGMSFVECVTQRRVEEAKRLLTQQPELPLKDVARMLGFSDQFYFSKVFRAATGAPPSEYRK